MTLTKTVDSIYNPGNLSEQELIERFVVRHKLFEKLYKEIATSDMTTDTTEHLLIVGLRGMGKTTLLLRLAYEIRRHSIANSYLPIVFSEEQYSIRTLYNFWESIAKILEEEHPTLFQGLFDKMDALYDTQNGDAFYEETIFNLLLTVIQQHQKKLILFIDNLQDFLKKLSKQETQRLREVLMTCKELRIIAAAPVTVEAIYDHRHPLFEQFKPFYLKGLTYKETTTVLKKLAQHFHQEDISDFLETNIGRVQALRQITGGVIRTIVLLFEIFIADKEGNIFKDLEYVLDRVSGLYKHRTDDLPKNQQVIIHAIAMNWDAMSTKEIAAKTRLESKAISAQLSQLAKNEWIETIPTKTKNHLYQLKERFYNIWYLMRYGRKQDTNRVLWLVRFFEAWYGKDSVGLKKHVDRSIYKLKNGKLSPLDKEFLFPTYIHKALGLTDYISNKYPEEFKGFLEPEQPEYADSNEPSVKELSFLEFLYKEDFLKEYLTDANDYLIFALAKKQYPLLLNYFNGEQGKAAKTKEKLKPIWFALMYYLQDDYPNEYLKMGGEFKETVEEIIAEVEKKREKYGD